MSYRVITSTLPRAANYGLKTCHRPPCVCRCHTRSHMISNSKRSYLMTVAKVQTEANSKRLLSQIHPAAYVLSTKYKLDSHQDSSYYKSRYLIGSSLDPSSLSAFHNNVIYRRLHTTKLFYKEESKVEKTVKALKEEATDVAKKPVEETVVVVKKSLWQRFVAECRHYYHGFRLLFIDIKIAARMVWTILNGKILSRREHRQLVRTTADLFRLVPFLVFLLVPFMEFLLPVAIKLFPSMLPSTFKEENKEQEKLKKQLKVKLEMAKFLQDTINESALQGKKSSGEKVQKFSDFMNKIRSEGIRPSTDDIIKFSKLFEDEMTLDNLSHQQLQALCRVLSITPIGTDALLRFQLKLKLRQLKADDKMIIKDGIESLSVTELQVACRARGMRALGVSEKRLGLQLQQWLDLHLNEKIPTSLLLLSRALYLPETLSTTQQLEATISTLSDTPAAEEAKLKVAELSGDKVDNKTKLDLIKHEEEAIQKEKQAQMEEEELDKAKQLEREAAEALAAQTAMDTKDMLHDEAAILDVKPGEELKDMAPAMEEPEEEKISTKDLEEIESALEEIAEQKQLNIEKEELQDLKEEVEEYKEDLEDLKSVILASGRPQEDLRESKAAQRLTKRVSKMISQLDDVISGLHKEKQKFQEELEVKQVRMKWTSEQKDDERLQQIRKEIAEEKNTIISINEMVLALKRIQKVPDETKLQTIVEVLDQDMDGIIDINDALKVIETLGRENVKLNKSQVTEMLELLRQEDVIQEEEKRREKEEKENTKQGTEQQQQQQQQ
ncbi:mitochondrial proton/calcium exchanger protein-like isoform X1 [Haliotis rufescens]|uniref:mitochondrial proton/calcium exchanger protein-like isoform X1 n=1 Tax=Haliotis rufescens TaxID=6454 RepID=UPI001EB029B2|nr:mitochondrial proton/calcium exchanger protein-like isoform X1 [Haliotis rufescens]